MFPLACDPHASLNRDRGVLVAKVAATMQALPDNADLDTLVNVAPRLLNPAWGLGSGGEQPVTLISFTVARMGSRLATAFGSPVRSMSVTPSWARTCLDVMT
jgi:hypothetical protein